MKNYELISLLSKLPAGAEVCFDSICGTSEVTIEEASDDDFTCIVSKRICEVVIEGDRIMLC